MSGKYKNILLCGFRATGKSTIGKLVAEKLGWKFIEMDSEIEKKAGKSIPELNKNGTDWQEFRETESDLLRGLIHQEYAVISAGGGVGVNNHINKKSNKTFGEEQKEDLKKAYYTLIIVFIAPSTVLKDRIIKDEIAKSEVQRPLLDEAKAKELEQKLVTESDPDKRKQITIEYIVEDTLKMYLIRQPLYEELSKTVIDTSEQVPEVIAKSIVRKIKESYGDIS